ncbi:MAG: cytosol nonspecific dipeptidase, partial [Bacteroidales bacterium]|nr:cytosol nonspecific dipeptidase [Bacteroidales bacterium]
MTIKDLEPKELWENFYLMTQVPRPSKHEEKVRAMLKKFAKENKIECDEDEVGNIIMRKPASKGMENRRGVILQSHMDMVPQKAPSSKHNFEKDPIETRIKDGWVWANDTTLGADNGMGAAAIMAI